MTNFNYTPAQARYQAARAAYLKLDEELTNASIYGWFEGKTAILASATRQLWAEWNAAYDEAQAAYWEM